MVYAHPEISFWFNKNSENFIVEELPLYPFAHTGEWLMLKIRKKGISTPEMIKIFSTITGIKVKEIGYAGLKDKEGLTFQWISVPRKYRTQVHTFSHPQIKIMEEDLHRNKLKIGHLAGNRFFIRLKKVLPSEAKKLYGVLKQIKKIGIPNFFGSQRFGKFGNNWQMGAEILEGQKRVRNRYLRKFLINAYQSKLFNDWLAYRIRLSNLLELSKIELKKIGVPEQIIYFSQSQLHPFKLLPGEVMVHYPIGKFFTIDLIEKNGKVEKEEKMDGIKREFERFYFHQTTFTGPLPGRKVKKAEGVAGKIERRFWQEIPVDGDRRKGWIFPEIIEVRYLKERAHFELVFVLPKGAYGTVLLKILGKGVKPFLTETFSNFDFSDFLSTLS